MAPERLQKVLASAGIASRRDCEVLISEGRVVVNGEVVSVAGTRVDPDVDTILVDGKPLGARQPRTYIMFHKPVGVVSTTEDPQGRPTVIDLVEVPQRLHLVGRLDFASEGLMLLTDDGALTQALTHPSNQVEKEYRVLLNDTPSADDLRDWRNGVELPAVEDETADNDNYDGADGEEATITTAPAWVEVIERTDSGTWVRVVLHEGRKRQIRRVATALGYDVLRLIRMREGPIMLGDLAAGAWRALTEDEIEKLQQHADRAESMARLIAAQKAKAAAKNAPKAPSDTPSAEEQDEIAPRGNRRDERPSHEDRPARSFGGDRPRGGDGPQRSFGGDRPQGGGFRRDGDRPRGGDGPQRSFGGDRPQGGGFRRDGDAPRSFGGDGDRPFRDRPFGADRPEGDRPQRSFGGDRPQRSFGGDRPQRSFGGDRPQRSFGGDRPQRSFGGDGDRPFRDRPFGADRADSAAASGEGRPMGDRPPRSFGGDRPQGGGFRRDGDAPRSFGDRPPRSFGGDRPQGGGFRRDGDAPRSFGGDRPRAGGFRREGDAPRTFGDRPARPFGNDNRPRGNFRPGTERPNYGGERDGGRPHNGDEGNNANERPRPRRKP